jgi:lysophospholipase L1-like esterase
VCAVLVLTSALVVPAGAQAPTWTVPDFADVPTTHPFQEAVRWMAATQVSSGYPDGTFRPADGVTRQAMSAFLHRLAGAPDPTTATSTGFSDVRTTHPFAEAITWMAEAGISTGWPDHTFRPAEGVSRQAMSAFLHRLAGSPAPTTTSTGFSDVRTGHPFAVAITWMAETDLSTGYGDGTYRPGDPVSRQAMSAFLHRLWQGPGLDPELGDRGPGPQGQGAWSAGTAYEPGDVVVVEDGALSGGAYLATTEQPAAAVFGSPFHQAVDERETAAVPVLVVGDSVTEGWGSTALDDPWPRRLQDLLRTRWPTSTQDPDGSDGYLASYYASESMPDPVVTGSPQEMWNHGFGWRALRFDAADESVTFQVEGTTAEVWHVRHPTPDAAIAVSVDGGPATILSQEGPTSDTVDVVPLGDPGPHTIEVAHHAGAQSAVGGVRAFDGDQHSGLHVVDGGHSGIWSEFLSNTTLQQTLVRQVELLDPGLVVINLGINDMGFGRDPAAYRTDLAAGIAALRAIDADLPILLVGAWAHAGSTFAHPWEDYVAAAESLATELGLPFLDMSVRWPQAGTPEANALGWYRDVVHLSSAGNAELADVLEQQLLDVVPGWLRIGELDHDV